MVGLDLGAFEDPEFEEVRITVDSGAAEPVCDPSTFPEEKVTPSAGSIVGQCYLGPGKERIPNMGEIKPTLMMESDGTGRITFQAAPVRKPLLAVSSVNDKGHMVVFDTDGSFLVPADAPEVLQVRALLQKVRGKIDLHRENGVFNIRAWRRKAAFVGQGRK